METFTVTTEPEEVEGEQAPKREPESLFDIVEEINIHMRSAVAISSLIADNSGADDDVKEGAYDVCTHLHRAKEVLDKVSGWIRQQRDAL